MSDTIPLFHQAYGSGLSELPAPVVRTHAVHDRLELSGQADTTHGTSTVARLLCRILRFPPQRQAAPLHITMTRTPDGECWRRMFGQHIFETRFRPGPTPGTVTEKLGVLSAISRLDTDQLGVTQVLVGLRCFALPVPRAFWPKLEVREGADGSRYRFSMSITLPWNALLVHYQGWLETNGISLQCTM